MPVFRDKALFARSELTNSLADFTELDKRELLTDRLTRIIDES